MRQTLIVLVKVNFLSSQTEFADKKNIKNAVFKTKQKMSKKFQC